MLPGERSRTMTERNHADNLAGAGGIREIKARWVFEAEMELVTAAHFGNGQSDMVDMIILKDPRSGMPILQGTTLAGALRSYLTDVLEGYNNCEPPAVSELFGGAKQDPLGDQSPLIFFNGTGKLPPGMGIEIRDGVAIDPESGTAEEHKKFDYEVIPPGTTFPLRCDLLIEQGKNENRLLNLLAIALEGLKNGEITLGMRKSRGLGKVRIKEWKAHRFDLTSGKGWIEWARTEHTAPLHNPSTYESIETAIGREFSAFQPELFNKQDKRQRVVIDLTLRFKDGVLIRSPGIEGNAPDVVHLTSGGKPIVPGTSIAGVLRSHALRIARLYGQKDTEQLVDELFGPREKGKASGNTLQASKIRISESSIDHSKERRYFRIAIDRFTGGVVEGALFDEGIQEKGQFALQIELRGASDPQIGLLLLVLRDLMNGELPIGGTSAVGRGYIEGDGTLTFLPSNRQLSLNSHPTKMKEEDLQLINKYIAALHSLEEAVS